MNKGKVFLVGAGPGDPGLITVKAAECLRRADAVVYDFLANPQLLSQVSDKAEMIYVGKSGADHTMPQEQINQLIVDLASSGKTVVRLKGGDPFIFGRGGEEAEELIAAGLPFEVVPGITSAIAVPAYAGIPLTHRSHTSTVGFITGHEDPTKNESSIAWDKLATGLGTLVFLMGVKNLPNITARLIAAGRSQDTPAALIRWGTTSRQATLVGTLADIAGKARATGFKPPAIFVVGEVVSLRETMNWFETRPLFGRRVLVTRTREQASGLSAGLAALGASVIECPTIRITAPADWSAVDEALDNLTGFDWLVLTSPNGVDWLFRRLREKGRDARALAPVKLAAIGPATARKLEDFGLNADLLPEEFVAESLVAALKAKGMEGKRILLARAAEARAVLPEDLAAAGAEVREVALYQTLPPDNLPPEALEALDQDGVDLVTFTSSSTVTNMAALLGERLEAFKSAVPAACIGPITAATAREAGFNVVVEGAEYTIEGLLGAVEDHFRSRR